MKAEINFNSRISEYIRECLLEAAQALRNTKRIQCAAVMYCGETKACAAGAIKEKVTIEQYDVINAHWFNFKGRAYNIHNLNDGWLTNGKMVSFKEIALMLELMAEGKKGVIYDIKTSRVESFKDQQGKYHRIDSEAPFDL